ncbi:MAG TPA: alpha/beta hydrolase [Alphaproteobacteria bacterium]|nr:alpha/beta hydrolase [Alphaproteobacteria bacterium]
MADPAKPAITERTIAAGGLSFELLEAGEGDRLALCLHGFPSHPMCWREQLPALAALGFRAWAPALRGYGKTTRPVGAANYTVATLLGDVAALIDASGATSVVLIAHDWGGLLAWFFAARRIRPLDGLIILNAPHPACAAVAYRKWKQMRKGWYIMAFQIPWLPDLILSANRAWAIGRLMVAAGGGKKIFPAGIIDFYRNNAAGKGAVTAMLNWYRGMMRGGVPTELAGKFPTIETRTLVIWGDADVALDFSSIADAGKYATDLTLHRLPGVSHWVQEEVPDQVNALIGEFLT